MSKNGLKLGDLSGRIREAAERQLGIAKKPRAKRFEGKVSQRKAMNLLVMTFDNRWKDIGGPELVSEYQFHGKRKWRLDRAHVASKVGIEIHGGIHTGGRHTRGKGFEGDREKMNAAQSLGWIVFELTPDLVRDEKQLRQIVEAITLRLSAANPDIGIPAK